MAILPISEMARAREEGLPPRCRARISSEALTVPWTREPATITATILGLAAQIEREFISARTKEALARRKAAGLPVGRPKGRATKLMLDDRRAEIVDYLNKGVSKRSVAKILGCSPTTLYFWIRRRRISGR